MNKKNCWKIKGFVPIWLFIFTFSPSIFALDFWRLERNIEEVDGDPPFLDYPVGVTIDSQDRILWVSDWGNNRVVAFSQEGNFLKAIVGLQGPVGLALRGDRLFIVEQKGNRVRIFDTKKLSPLGELRPAKSSFREPRGIWVDSEGKVYVADTGNSRIVVFGPSGEEIASFGKEGMGDGEFYYPRGITVDQEGQIWVVDTAHNCVQVLDKNGKFLFRFGQEGSGEDGFRHPRYIFIRSEFVFLSDYRNHRIKIYDRKGVLLALIGGEEGIGELQFSYPEGLWMDQEGVLWVADAGNNRVKAINVEAFLQPRKYLSSLVEEGKIEDFLALWENLSPQERQDPEVARLAFQIFQKKGDLEKMIAQAEELFLNDGEHRKYWRKKLGELYYLKGKNLRKLGNIKEARDLYLRSFQHGYLHSLFPFVWLSFLLMGGSNILLLILALVLLVLLWIFYRVRMHWRRWSRW
ncbi:MAG: 6-bladed beta-propeller [Candidatus Caldatribacteriaceae bacterium]